MWKNVTGKKIRNAKTTPDMIGKDNKNSETVCEGLLYWIVKTDVAEIQREDQEKRK